MNLKRGDTLNWDITYKDENGTALDITGYQIKCQAKLNKHDTELLFDLAIGSGITVTIAVNGEYNIKVLDTTSYPYNKYYVDIEYTNISNEVMSTNTFELNITRDITI